MELQLPQKRAASEEIEFADDPIQPPQKRAASEEPDVQDAAGKEEIVSYGFLGDGRFEIITTKRTILFSKRVTEYLQSINKLRNLQIDGKGYICSGYTPLHRFVGDAFCLTDKQVREQYPEHFKAHPHDRTVIMHLDNDKLNFNIENLERGPQMLNNYMKMRQPRKNGDKYYGTVTVNKRQEYTKTVKTVDEAKHAIDILKMQKMLPELRSFILKHAMHKPAAYAEHYTSVETRNAFSCEKKHRSPSRTAAVSAGAYSAVMMPGR